ncbi:unnamed protein product [Prorocentrum cordatum]|uniref:Uncharacterized protein n=1 Tax=Prorocentrum cordatum TaxID=2364126 RepID=A0ABN9T9J7_9DINO|nr:unnamed protein product [Polarella glacialis]
MSRVFVCGHTGHRDVGAPEEEAARPEEHTYTSGRAEQAEQRPARAMGETSTQNSTSERQHTRTDSTGELPKTTKPEAGPSSPEACRGRGSPIDSLHPFGPVQAMAAAPGVLRASWASGRLLVAAA